MAKRISEMSRRELVDASRHILNTCKDEGRDPTQSEDLQLDEYENAIDRLSGETPKGGGLQMEKHGIQNSRPKSPGTFAYFDQKKSQWVRDVGRGESIAASTGEKIDSDAPSLAGMILGQATGCWHGLERERAAIQTSQDASGGFLVGSATAAQFIDKARSAMVMEAAGIRTIQFPEQVNELGIGRVSSDPTSYWRNEGVAITSSTPTFDKIYLRPKTLGCLVPVSIEWLEDVVNGQQMIEDIISRSMAVALDAAILRGTGNPGPTGIANATGITTTTSIGAWSYDTILDGLKKTWDANSLSQPTAVILSVASELKRRKMKDGDGNFLTIDRTPLVGVPFLMTSSIPDTLGSGAATELYTGDFSKVLLAYKTQLKVEVLPAGTADSINAVSQMYRWIRVYLRADCHIERADHLWFGSGATN